MLEIRNLNLCFGNKVIYKDFNLLLNKGDKIAITGKSGVGKSSLLNLLMGFIPDYSGEVVIDGILLNSSNVEFIRQRVAWLSQDISLDFSTVEELFFAPFEFRLNRSSIPNREAIVEVFDKFDLPVELLKRNLKEISGGQKQRVILASCCLLNKPLLLLDEPTSALDKCSTRRVADYILQNKDLTALVVTHDAYWIEKSDDVLYL